MSPFCCLLQSIPRHALVDVYLCACVNEDLDNVCLSTATGSKERLATVNVGICPSVQQLTNHGLVALLNCGVQRRSKITRTDVGIWAFFNQ